jgi:hypothetical protein
LDIIVPFETNHLHSLNAKKDRIQIIWRNK